MLAAVMLEPQGQYLPIFKEPVPQDIPRQRLLKRRPAEHPHCLEIHVASSTWQWTWRWCEASSIFESTISTTSLSLLRQTVVAHVQKIDKNLDTNLWNSSSQQVHSGHMHNTQLDMVANRSPSYCIKIMGFQWIPRRIDIEREREIQMSSRSAVLHHMENANNPWLYPKSCWQAKFMHAPLHLRLL